MTNRDIRKKARSLFRSNFGRIAGLSLLMMLVSIGLGLAAGLTTTFVEAVPAAMIAFFILYIATLVMSLGMSLGFLQVCRNVWNGEPAGVGTLFSKFRRIPRMLGIAFIMGALFMVIYFPMIIAVLVTAFMPEEMAGIAAILLIVFFIALIVGLIWAELRFSLATYCIVIRPELGIFECLRASWIATKRNVGRVLCNGIMLMLPVFGLIILVLIAASVIPALLPYSETTLFIAIIAAYLAIILMMTFAQGYMTLGLYGLAEYLLGGGESGVPVLANYGVWPAPAAPIEPAALPEAAEESSSEPDPQ